MRQRGFIETEKTNCGYCGQDITFRIYDGHSRFEQSGSTRYRHKLKSSNGDDWIVCCELVGYLDDDIVRTRKDLGL